MVKLYLFLCALGWHNSAGLPSGNEIDTHIIGGTDAPAGALPYQIIFKVKVRDSDLNFCGGGIIRPRWVLTAAHCTKAVEKAKLKLEVVVGTNKAYSGGTWYEADKLISHEDYSRDTWDNDIALVRTVKDIEFNDLVAPVALPDAATPADTKCVIAGVGYSDYDTKQFPQTMQMINLTTISTKECQEELNKYGNTISERQICTYIGVNKGTCKGDSGGPLVANNKVIGVVSWGVLCARGEPDVFTAVYPYLDWIYDNIKQNS